MSDKNNAPLLRLGAVIRQRRQQAGLSRPQVCALSDLSVRFLAKVETGSGNISYLRLYQLAHALHTDVTTLIAEAETPAAQVIALLGLRGAGKSTVGSALAQHLGVPLVELDKLIEAETGLDLGQIFEMQGEGYFRRVEREVLNRFLWEGNPAVLATSGGIVSDPEAFNVLLRGTTTVWLRATPKEHWTRVMSQGDRRPMEGYSDAMAELENLWQTREPLYSSCSFTVDTSNQEPQEIAAAIEANLSSPQSTPV